MLATVAERTNYRTSTACQKSNSTGHAKRASTRFSLASGRCKEGSTSHEDCHFLTRSLQEVNHDDTTGFYVVFVVSSWFTFGSDTDGATDGATEK